MLRLSYALCLLLIIASAAFSEDAAPLQTEASFATNLMSVKHIELAVDKEVTGYIVRAFSKPQFDEQMALIEGRRKELIAYRDSIQEINAQIKEALAAGGTGEDVSKMRRELAELQRKSMTVPRKNPKLRHVIEVGSDYLGVQSPYKKDEITLIPFNRISQFVRESDSVSVTDDSHEEAPEDDSKSE